MLREGTFCPQGPDVRSGSSHFHVKLLRVLTETDADADTDANADVKVAEKNCFPRDIVLAFKQVMPRKTTSLKKQLDETFDELF